MASLSRRATALVTTLVLLLQLLVMPVAGQRAEDLAFTTGSADAPRHSPTRIATGVRPINTRGQHEPVSAVSPPAAARLGEAISAEGSGAHDPVAQTSTQDTRSLGQLSDPLVEWNGMGGSNPNDTTGDVGPNHFVQAINSQVQVFDKQGTSLEGPTLLGQYWNNGDGTTDACEGNAGDPIVLYDNLVDRWMIAQFSRFAPFANFMCLAVSQTSDPRLSQGYYGYAFNMGEFPDYPKIGAWTDGYYFSANGAGALAAVFDRVNMLNGNPAGMVQWANVPPLSGFDTLMPSDIDGSAPPPAGSPGYFYRPLDGDQFGGADRLELYEGDVNWADPAASTLTGPIDIGLAPFDMTLCGFNSFGCIPQPGASGLLDPINEIGMFRFPYRNYVSREVLAGNFTVDVDGNDSAGIRWFVLERTGGSWSVADQGTYAPQPAGAPAIVHRFVGSLAMDRFGNLAIGHTRVSDDHPPGYTGFASAVYTGRKAGDPAGLLPQPEIEIQPGTGSLGTGNADTRWGDYYTMVVDPVDDCTFWYTGDYATTIRQSVIASFRFDDCATDLAISKSVSPTDPNAGEEIVYTVTVTNNGPLEAANVVVTDELPPEVTYLADTDTCSGVAVGSTGTLTCALGNLAAGASTSFEIKVKVDPDLGGATSITNTASVSSDTGESNSANNAVSLTHLVNESADVAVTKLCKPDSNPAQAGTDGICTILVTNNGPSAAREVELSDTHVSDGAFTITGATSSQGSCVISGADVDCSLGDIQPGAGVQVDVSITSPDGVDVNDVAQVTSATPDPVSANNQASAGLSFSASADLSITKDGPTEVDFLGSFSYTLEVTNAGPSTATNVVVTDTLPAGVEYVSSTPSVGTLNVAGNVVTWNVGNLAASASASLQIDVQVLPSAPATLLNNASVTSDTADPDGSNNQASWTTTVNGTDLWLDKQANVSAQNPSGALVYLITVHNEPGQVADDTPTSGHGGPNAATNVVVSDPLPLTSKKMVVQFLSTGCVYDQPSHTVTCSVASLAAGTSVTFEIQVQIKGSVGSFTNSATVTSDTFDPNPANNGDTVTTVYQGSTGKGPKPK